MREHAHVVTSGVASRILIGHARDVCREFLEAHPNPVKVKSKDGVCKTCSILRHKGTNDPACLFDQKFKLQGEGCINDCF